MDGLPTRLDRVNKYGTSSTYGESLEELILCNRAGKNESELTLDEIYTAYCLRKPLADGWIAK